MKKMRPLFVANWKMNKSLADVIHFFTENTAFLAHLSSQAEIVICPSFVAIPTAVAALENTQCMVGAQECSPYESGAYTGQVDALSLKQAGCSYCIIGHSENRMRLNEDSKLIAQKAAHLINHSLIPIVCVGHSIHSESLQQLKQTILEQLIPVLIQIKKNPTPFCVAYEPTGAIGTGIVPAPEHIQEIGNFIHTLIHAEGLSEYARILYGGSVDEENSKIILSLESISGLLIGKSSLDFQKFKNIVL